jgi:hypothetical protein
MNSKRSYTKKQIAEGYTWVKVPRYEDDPSLDLTERLSKLEAHHKAETTFLIDFIRALANGDIEVK